jgi:lactoylglutathione lyase
MHYGSIRSISMHVEHVAIWTSDIGRCKRFYATYFDAVAGPHYQNSAKGFESCFLGFGSGARLEVMTTTLLRALSWIQMAIAWRSAVE